MRDDDDGDNYEKKSHNALNFGQKSGKRQLVRSSHVWKYTEKNLN